MGRLCLDGAATESFATGGGQAWKFLLPTQTSSYFLLFIVFGVVFIFLTRRVIVIVASALARARVWDVGPRAVFGIVNRLRPWTGRALRRMVFLVGASAPIACVRAGGTGGVGVLEEGRGGLCGASSRGAARRHGGDRSWRGMWNIDGRILRSNRMYSAESRDCDEWCRAPPRADPGCEGALARDWELLGGEGGQDN